MMGTTYNDKTKKVGITLPNSLIKQTDKLRGDVKRSIRRAIENYLKQGKMRRPLRGENAWIAFYHSFIIPK
jgi:metal-responsive CopG/Arc/MetJ family transcriptional regulator